jgi:hypothetical protein
VNSGGLEVVRTEQDSGGNMIITTKGPQNIGQLKHALHEIFPFGRRIPKRMLNLD